VKQLEFGSVDRITEIRPDIWSMWIHAPQIASQSRPGQFLHIRVADSFKPLLRRPISIGRIAGDMIELVWRVVGEGTRILAEVKPGEHVDLLGPLGNGFTLPEKDEHAVLVGGGLGGPPLVYLHETLLTCGIASTCYLGAKTEQDLPLAGDDPILEKVDVYTESESSFNRGLVTEPLTAFLNTLDEKSLSKTVIYSCGPWGLVGALQRVLPKDRLSRMEVSLEQQMGCGIGVCQGCAVTVSGGPTPYQLVCSDGPVFELFSVEVPGAV